MNAHPSTLGRQAGMLPIGYKKIKKMIFRWLEKEWKMLDSCRTEEIFLTIEAINISKLKLGMHIRNGELTLKCSSNHNFSLGNK